MYREKIAKLAPGYDPAHVEAVVLSRGVSIESIPSLQLEAEIATARTTIAEMLLRDEKSAVEVLDHVAQSFGLKPRSLRR